MLLENIEGDKNPKMVRGWTPLHSASKNGHTEVVKMLLVNMEGDKNPKDVDDWTPLHWAGSD